MTGYEDWVRYRVTDPALALDRLQLHVQGLSEILSGGRVQADGVVDDPALLMAMLAPGSFLTRELNRLSGVVHRVGLPMLQPTRRVDGGTVAPPDTGVGNA